jgi:methylenetetrahydrofolate--tRNA-(uracil-5-)-methyltransferase
LLDETLRLKTMPRLRFAGQITGCEGYVESAAIGLLAGRFAAAERLGNAPALPPSTTRMAHCSATLPVATSRRSTKGPPSFQPMNVNFGLFPPLTRTPTHDANGNRVRGPAKAVAKKQALCARALNDLEAWLGGGLPAAAE